MQEAAYSQPDGTQARLVPPTDDKEAWKAYWQERGQTWRTEPGLTQSAARVW